METQGNTLLAQFLPANYSDTFQREVIGQEAFTPEELLSSLFIRTPWWVDSLMKLRNMLVKPLGLKGGEFKEHLAEMVLCQNESEIVWGMNDKHLCFYVSIGCSEWVENRQTASITTIVKYNNFVGKAYFFLIKPFHRIIIKSILKRI